MIGVCFFSEVFSVNLIMSYRSTRHPIYGVRTRKVSTKTGESPCVRVVCPDLTPAFVALATYIKESSEVIGTCYDRPALVSEFIAPIRGKMLMSPRLLIRVLWRQTYPTGIFNINDVYHRLQIKDLYIAYGYSYAVYSLDPLFRDAIGAPLIAGDAGAP